MNEILESIDVSIIIPVKNGMPDIEKCLSGIFRQKKDLSYEVIVIDSGSVDNTVETVKKFPVQLVVIKPEEFGHGKTRNLGADLAKGTYLVFLTQDACPVDETWMENLIKNFNDDKVAGVYSRWIPKEDCNPLELRRISEAFTPIKEIRTIEGINKDDYLKYIDKFIHFSNVSSALRKNVWKKIPFNDNAIFAEDQEWAKEVIEAGYSVIYEPESKVYHSHNDSLKQRFKRGFDGAQFLRQTTKYSLNPLYHLGVFIFLLIEDWLFILRNKYSFLKKVKWMIYSISLNSTAQLSVFLGALRKTSPKE